MTVKLIVPHQQIDFPEVDKVLAPTPLGWICLLPRHLDCLSTLAPGIVTLSAGSEEQHLAVRRGTLVKCGDQVRLATREALMSRDLETLRHTVDTSFVQVSERERRTRATLARLESDFIRRFLELRR